MKKALLVFMVVLVWLVSILAVASNNAWWCEDSKNIQFWGFNHSFYEAECVEGKRNVWYWGFRFVVAPIEVSLWIIDPLTLSIGEWMSGIGSWVV